MAQATSSPVNPGFWAAVSTFPAEVRRNLTVLFLSQAFATGATTVSTTLSSIIIFDLTGSESLSGLPSTVNFFVSAFAAYWAGRIMSARGRRFGLSLGYAIGAIGATLGGAMALEKNLLGFLIGGALVGVANGAIQQAKYAAGEMVPGGVRGSVVGGLLTGSAFGSVLSWLVSPLVHDLSVSRGVSPIEAGWFLGAMWLALGAVLIWTFLRPDPRDIAIRLASTDAARETSAGSALNNTARGDAIQGVSSLQIRSWSALLQEPGIRLALISMGLGQMVMVALMVLMPLHAKHLGHESAATGLISVHILGMFAFGWLTGRLVDGWGRKLVIQMGAALLMIAGFIAVFATRPLEMGFSLFVLGLGWNFLNVAGSTLLTDFLRPHERARTQGGAELVTWLSAAIGALGGGLIVGAFGFPVIGWVGLGLGCVPFIATLILSTSPKVQPLEA
jgi:MFS family permease